MKIVDVVILSLCTNPEIYKMNLQCINSLIDSERHIKFNIYMIESNKNFFDEWSYPLDNVKVVFPDGGFNYNRYINVGLNLTRSEFVCFCNNDLIYNKNWFSEILRFADIKKEVSSFSPYDPNSQEQSLALKGRGYSIGYRVRSEVVGWCIVMKRKALNYVFPLDEVFDYYFQDNDYAYTLRRNNIKHALVGGSNVNHLENMTSKIISGWSYGDRGRFDEIKFLNKWGGYRSLGRKNRIHKYINTPLFRPLSRILYSKAINLDY